MGLLLVNQLHRLFLASIRILLVSMQDREDPHSCDKMVQGIALDAKFASQVDQLRPMSQVSSMDGFVFSVDPLFQLDPAVRWFLQVSYSVQPVGNGRWKRASTPLTEVEASRRGTNMRVLQLAWTDQNWSHNSNNAFSGGETTLVSSLIAAALLIILVIIVFVLLFLYFRPARKSRAPVRPLVKSKTRVNDPVITAEETTLI